MTHRLFVYGTLAPDGPNRHVLAEIDGEWRPARVRGHLQQAGWGAGLGYPAIVLDSTAELVTGQIFVSRSLAEIWDELDAFEGAEYERVVTEAQLEDGTVVSAFTYVLRK